MTLAIYPLSSACKNGALSLHRRKGARLPAKNVSMPDREKPSLPASDMSEQIVAIAMSADMAAFETLFKEYSPRIRAYLLKLTRNGQAAEDLMQEILLAI